MLLHTPILLLFFSNTGNAIYSVPPQCLNMNKLLYPRGTESNTSTSKKSQKIDLSPVMVFIRILQCRVMNVSVGAVCTTWGCVGCSRFYQ